MAAGYPELYLQGVEHFNAGRYFEAHDAWEEHWMEEGPPEADFYQGLIQAAVALHHLEGGNLTGALRLYRSFSDYLKGYRPHHLGLDLEGFLQGMKEAFARAQAGGPQARTWDPALAPRIQLHPQDRESD